MNFVIVYEHSLRTNESRHVWREIQHVTLAEQTVGAVFIEDHPTIDLGCDLECDPAGNVRFDYAGDNIGTGRLRRHNQMNPSCARHLRDAGDCCFHIRRRSLH